MPRRSGKAASRRARQQRRSRHPAARGPSAARPAAAPGLPSASGEAARAPSAAPTSPSGRPFAAGLSTVGSSRLGEAARAEYHYVARDLRNTGLLVLLMAALLGVAVIAVNLAGIGPS